MIEKSAVLMGRCRAGCWRLRLRRPRWGGPASVEVDWSWALEQEESRGDVAGFYHTHPDGSVAPSRRDVRTMQAWVSCFGKPLVCVIEGEGAVAAYLFESDEEEGRPLPRVEKRGAWLTVRMQVQEPVDERSVLS